MQGILRGNPATLCEPAYPPVSPLPTPGKAKVKEHLKAGKIGKNQRKGEGQSTAGYDGIKASTAFLRACKRPALFYLCL